MRALILVAGAALALVVAAPAVARERHGEHCDHRDRYENPYSNASMRRERERKELATDIAKAERIEREKERASRVREQDDDQADDDSDEDDPDDG